MILKEIHTGVSFVSGTETRTTEVRTSDFIVLLCALYSITTSVIVLLSFTPHVGVQHVAPIEQFPDDKWEQLIAVNLSASFHTMKLAVPGMKERGMLRT